MIHKHALYYLRHAQDDIPAGLVVFLVALPLCLGVALASGAPLFSGLIAGMIGGLIVSWLSGSQLSVSGPAAGLTVIVYNAIESLGSFQGFLMACVLAGIIQLLLGFLRAGIIGAFFPAAVIKGMLAAIGLILIIKQIPHATGYDASYEGDESYMRETAESSFSEVFSAFHALSPGAMIISSVALLILIAWDSRWIKKQPLLKFIPAPLVAVIWSIFYNRLIPQWDSKLAVSYKHLVNLPLSHSNSNVWIHFHIPEFHGFYLSWNPQPLISWSPPETLTAFLSNFSFPDFSYLIHPQTYSIALTLAIIASLETLLSLEATDKLDPLKRLAPTNRELKAQGIGNIISGLIGGLPITAVIVRSSANINAGGKTSLSCFTHGVLLFLSVMFFSEYLNQIPLSCLSAILLHTGYKLAKPTLFKEHFNKGYSQFLPFIFTVVAILLTDLLKGILIGIGIGLFFVIRANYHASISLTKNGSHYLLSFNKDVSFLNKALLRKFILLIEENSTVLIDAHKAQFIDHDILETVEDFIATAADDGIKIEIIDLYGKEKISSPQTLWVIDESIRHLSS
jgi:MFS superfamily sulfate permease-like transporter